MTNVLLLLILLIPLTQTAFIMKSTDFSLAFKDLNEKVDSVKVKFNFNNTATQREKIAQLIASWSVNFDDKTGQQTSVVLSQPDRNSKGCQPKVSSFKQVIRQVTRVDFDASIFYPGKLLQIVDSSNFARGIIPISVSDNKRNSFTINLSNGLSGTFEANLSSFRLKLNEFIGKNADYLSNQPVQLYVEEAINIQSVLRQLKLSTKIYQDLQIGGFTADKLRNNEGRIVVVLYQKLFSASLDLSPKGNQSAINLVETIFSPLYTFDQFQKTAQSLNWRVGNAPQLVSQTNFGRLLVISIENNAINQNLIDRLSNCFNNGNQPQPACFDSAMGGIQKNPSARYYVAGVDTTSVIERNNAYPVYRENVNWKKVFADFNSQKIIESLRPLSAKLIDLLGKNFFQVQTRYFSILVCSKVPEITIKISEVQSQCIVTRKGIKDNNFHQILFNTNSPKIFDIGSITGWQPFEMKFTVKGRRSSSWKIWKKQFRKKLSFTISINGYQKLVYIMGNVSDGSEFREFTYRIDPIKGTVR